MPSLKRSHHRPKMKMPRQRSNVEAISRVKVSRVVRDGGVRAVRSGSYSKSGRMRSSGPNVAALSHTIERGPLLEHTPVPMTGSTFSKGPLLDAGPGEALLDR